MGNNLNRIRISSLDESNNLKYFNIYNYSSKFYSKHSLQYIRKNSLFYKEYYNESNTDIIIMSLYIKKKYYSTSLWILKNDDQSYNIYAIKYHISKKNINNTINHFIELASKI